MDDESGSLISVTYFDTQLTLDQRITMSDPNYVHKPQTMFVRLITRIKKCLKQH